MSSRISFLTAIFHFIEKHFGVRGYESDIPATNNSRHGFYIDRANASGLKI